MILIPRFISFTIFKNVSIQERRGIIPHFLSLIYFWKKVLPQPILNSDKESAVPATINFLKGRLVPRFSGFPCCRSFETRYKFLAFRSNKPAPRLNPFIFLCLLISIFVLSFAAQASPANKYGGQLVISTTSDPRSFNEIIAKEQSTSMITALIFEGLTTVNAFTLKVEPNLAESWDVSPSGQEWTFHLRKDIFWNDGVPFTAEDVVFTFNDLIYNPDIPSSSRDIFTIDGKPFQVVKLDDYTVKFILPVKFAPFLRGMSQEILPEHKLKKAVDDKKFNYTWGIDADPKEIVGTGPFKLLEYRPGERVVFERNPFYWKKSEGGDKLPYLDRVMYLIVPNGDVELLKFLEGSVDAYDLRGMDYAYLRPLEKERNFTVHDLGPDMGSRFIVFNQNSGVNPKTQKPYLDPVKLSWFTNPKFKQAVAHAIDKKQIIEIIYYGLGYDQISSMGPGAGFFYNPNVKVYEYNLAKAKQILDEAGFKDRDGDGIIEDPGGHKVEFNLYTNADNTERLDLAGIIRHDLESLGMKINFLPVEFNTLVSKLNSTFDWDAMVMGLTGGVEPHFGKNVWTSGGQLHMWYPTQEKPATDWEKRIDELFSLGVQELNEDKRKVYYDEFQMIVSEKLPMIFTVLSSKISAVRNKFGNLKPSNFGGLLHNLEEIYVK